tara:strand:+ start:683 stop:973 length:291 start_codon:yes stop_codon:yes gene_type:complete
MLDLFIDADAKTYVAESYVVHKKIINMTEKTIKRILLYLRDDKVSTTNDSLVIRLFSIKLGPLIPPLSNNEIDRFDRTSILKIHPILPINMVPNII